MAQSSDHRLLLLGAFAGAAGVCLAVALLQTRRRPALFLGGDAMRAAGAAEAPAAAYGAGQQVGQAEVLWRLGDLTQCVSELKDEVRALKDALPALRDHVRDVLREPAGGAVGGAGHRDSPLRGRTTPSRRRRAPASASRAGGVSSTEAESEGGYMTALTDSEEDEQSMGGQSGEEEEPSNELLVLLERFDALHKGTDADKRESLGTLLERREEFGQSSDFLWRLIRAYADLHDISSTIEEKKTSAEAGKKIGEEAVVLHPSCAEIHQWYAIVCGIMTEYETVQNKIKNGYIFKDHLDKAIELKPQDPMSYYLLGRWCYAVAQLSWIERKVAATLFGEPPNASVQDALNYFLKVEEISPKYSKNNYVFLAKCYRDLSQKGMARKMCEAACSMETNSKEDEEAQRELDSLLPSL